MYFMTVENQVDNFGRSETREQKALCIASVKHNL